MSSICDKLREARELAETSAQQEAIDKLIKKFCEGDDGEGTVSPSGTTGGGPNGPPG